MKIVVLDGYTVRPAKDGWDELKEVGHIEVYDRTRPEDILRRIEGAEYVYTNKCVIDSYVIDNSPRLKWIGVLATGYNVVDIKHAEKKGIPVCNVPAYSTMAVVQHTFALLLQICNRIEEHAGSVAGGDWQRCPDFCYWLYSIKDLQDRTLGIFGYGNIGRKVAKIAAQFGMKVLIFSRHPDDDLKEEGISFAKEPDEVFKNADVISLHCPLTEDNEGMINAENISKMKDGVIILNTARGRLVVEDDLAQAIKSGKVQAAGIDVLRQEPPVAGSPLIGLRNCIVTSHLAWSSEDSRKRLYETACSNLITFHRTGKPVNAVNDIR